LEKFNFSLSLNYLLTDLLYPKHTEKPSNPIEYLNHKNLGFTIKFPIFYYLLLIIFIIWEVLLLVELFKSPIFFFYNERYWSISQFLAIFLALSGYLLLLLTLIHTLFLTAFLFGFLSTMNQVKKVNTMILLYLILMSLITNFYTSLFLVEYYEEVIWMIIIFYLLFNFIISSFKKAHLYHFIKHKRETINFYPLYLQNNLENAMKEDQSKVLQILPHKQQLPIIFSFILHLHLLITLVIVVFSPGLIVIELYQVFISDFDLLSLFSIIILVCCVYISCTSAFLFLKIKKGIKIAYLSFCSGIIGIYIFYLTILINEWLKYGSFDFVFLLVPFTFSLPGLICLLLLKKSKSLNIQLDQKKLQLLEDENNFKLQEVQKQIENFLEKSEINYSDKYVEEVENSEKKEAESDTINELVMKKNKLLFEKNRLRFGFY
jgi:hypothetical protein